MKWWLVICGCVLLSMGNVTAAEPSGLVDDLRKLQPLAKVHYSWPVPDRCLRKVPDELCTEYVRLTGAVSLRGEDVTPDQLRAAIALAAGVARPESAGPATIAINYSPWHRRFGRELPATDVGASHQAEIDEFRDRMTTIARMLRHENARIRPGVRVSALLLDSERFVVPGPTTPMAAQITAAIREKHDAIYQIAKEVFPGAKVIWYQFGAVQLAATKSGWAEATWHVLDEMHDTYSVDLYRVPEFGYTHEEFRRTVERARAFSNGEVTPWIALAAGLKRRTTGAPWAFTRDWDYDHVYSWQLGREINNAWFGDRPDRFAPWNAAKVVCFYPKPGDTRSPGWWKHFLAYAKGANNIPLADDEPR